MNAHPENQSADVSTRSGDVPTDAASRCASVERLFREHNATLLRYLMAQLRSEQEAKDVAQEAYVRLLQLDARQAQAVNHPPAFLYKTPGNLAIDRLRTRQIAARASQVGFFEPTSRAVSPDTEVAAAEELDIIEQCLRELPAKYRQAFFLSRCHGLSCADIARHMHIATRTVRFYVAESVGHCRSRVDRLMSGKTV